MNADGSPAVHKLATPDGCGSRRDECYLACARWLVKSARPITLPERDIPFRDFIHTLCRGAWTPPRQRRRVRGHRDGPDNLGHL